VAGLWTPVAGVLAAIVEAWIEFSVPNNAGFPAILGVLGATLAMIGLAPGRWMPGSSAAYRTSGALEVLNYTSKGAI
jgi:hypothetical protein